MTPVGGLRIALLQGCQRRRQLRLRLTAHLKHAALKLWTVRYRKAETVCSPWFMRAVQIRDKVWREDNTS